MTAITVTTPGVHDEFWLAALTGIDTIHFAAPGDAWAIFDRPQLEDIVQIIGNSHENGIQVLIDPSLGSLPRAFSAAGWTFSNWVSTSDSESFDHVDILGAYGPDTIIGSSGINIIEGRLGADALTGGASDDDFTYFAGPEIEAGETVDGRGGFDAIHVEYAGDYDFSAASLSNVERLSVDNPGGTVIFNEDQIGREAIRNVVGSNHPGDGLIHLLVVGSSVNLSEVTFHHWKSRDTIGIVGNSIRANHLVGSNQADTLIGAPGSDDVMHGRDGRDFLRGGTGNDTLTGNRGDDRFVFDAALTDGTTINRDHITDFHHREDVIRLQHTIFSHIPAGSLSSDAFHLGANPGDAADRILYNQDRGRLYYDPDGTGPQAKVLFAILDNHAIVSPGDFVIS